ncbi:hypothetical protein LXA43DRAFT_330336 [Ganoderma leucocontextum]|nr:hypothetical protein LXA43DRAFT_330336 [Ganoderma leucocontextum]
MPGMPQCCYYLSTTVERIRINKFSSDWSSCRRDPGLDVDTTAHVNLQQSYACPDINMPMGTGHLRPSLEVMTTTLIDRPARMHLFVWALRVKHDRWHRPGHWGKAAAKSDLLLRLHSITGDLIESICAPLHGQSPPSTAVPSRTQQLTHRMSVCGTDERRRARANDDCKKARCVQHTTAQDLCCFCWYGFGASSATDEVEVSRVPWTDGPNSSLNPPPSLPPPSRSGCWICVYFFCTRDRPPSIPAPNRSDARVRAQ